MRTREISNSDDIKGAVMSKHTPGPWNVTHGSIIPRVYGPDDNLIAEIQPQRRRDAHLIAAAPELLAALNAASEWLNDMGCEHEEPDLRCVVCLVNAAINKAEGR